MLTVHFVNFRKVNAMNDLNEKLLDTWINLITHINSNRLTSKMPLNEAIILRTLYHAGNNKVTATYLCQKLGIQKSQMNRILQNMEDKDLIIRERSADDKRQVFIYLNSNQLTLYRAQHAEILEYIDNIIQQLGTENTKHTIELLNKIITIAKGGQI